MLTLLVNFLILVVLAVVAFYVVKYLLDQAEADPPIRKIVLLIVLLAFLVAVVNLISGGPFWGPLVIVGPR